MSFTNRKVIISKMEKSADREKGTDRNQMVRTETKGRGQKQKGADRNKRAQTRRQNKSVQRYMVNT